MKPRSPRQWPSYSGKPEERAAVAMSRLEDITRLVSEIIWEVDERGLLTFVSPRAFELLGLPPEQLLGQKLTNLGTFFSAGQKEMEPNWDRPFRDHMYKVKDVHGGAKIFLVSGLPHFDKKTWQYKGGYGIAEDITESLETEKTLRKLSRAVEQSPNAIFITDTQGAIEYVNPKFTELTGYTAEEAVGQNPRILKCGDTPPATYVDMWKTIQAGQEWRGEIKDRRKNGDHFWANETIAPVTNESGWITHYVATHENITARKDAELAAQAALVQAEVANRAKSNLMANMSHELRTPLNAIIGFSSIMKEETFGPLGHVKYLEYLDDIRYSSQHLLELINDILDVSAIEVGALTLHEERVDLSDIITSSMRIIKPRADEGQVTISCFIDAGIPLVHVDKRRTKQILLNLLSNAVKFTPRGGQVAVSTFLNDDGSLVIAVRDTGVGMDDDELKKALSKFGQVDSELNRKHEGTGLGLPLTIGLMDVHGGNLDIESVKGRGTLMKATFPKERVIRNAV